MILKTLDGVNLKNKNVLLRTDFNVPIKNGIIVDDFRIKESLNTIKFLLRAGVNRIFIMSHFGRPKGVQEEFKMDVIAKKLYKLSGRSIQKIDDLIFDSYDFESKIVLLENLRFFEGEEKNSEDFAKKLASLADIYVNDAFGVCHRKHASVHAITKFLPSYAGLLVQKEVEVFDEVLNASDRPLTAILGGSKLETKIPVIKNLITRVDNLLIGGGMIFTFYSAKGYNVGRSLVDHQNKTLVKMLLNNDVLKIPRDVIIADEKDNPTQILNVTPDKIPTFMMGLDIGKKTFEEFKKILSSSKLIVWNGPLGYYENDLFAHHTNELMKYLASLDAKVVIGGGDTAAIVEKLGLKKHFYHVSTGGGASLKLLEGETLPALEKLMK
ncbi:MAG: phosphoglycerate kinase [Candidatus Woesearchaeota archaeon]